MPATVAVPRAVLCDLDDTLYPERQYLESGIAAVAAFLAPRLEREARELERISLRLLAAGREQLFDRLLHELGAYREALVAAAVHVYRTHSPLLQACADVPRALKRLRAAGCRLALVSDGKATVQHAKFAALGLASLFEAVVCTDDLPGAASKPSPLGFEVALEHLGIAAQDACYLADDGAKDFLGPRALGMVSIRIDRGLPFPLAARSPMPASHAADHVVNDLSQAADWLLAGAEAGGKP